MKTRRFLIDINVVLDLILARAPFDVEALKIFSLAEAKEVDLFLSSDAISTIAYLVEKNRNKQTARQTLAILLDYVSLAPLDEEHVMKALALDFSDIEDSLAAAVADSADVEAIITRNTKDFKNSPVPAITPGEFMSGWDCGIRGA
ncbi:MAG TPA: toxin-antitoxin system, toxin component, PIN family protein [Coriobacteriia bacterium]|nr:toxin-antitoxin system, toxin component, PIN family protein [Coriobacteriia bacterium]